MREYRKIVQFSYNNQKYNMYLDKNNRRFFMKVNSDGSLSYLTGDELIEMSKLFIKNSDILMIGKDFEKINIVPKILTISGAVLLTSSLLFNFLSKESKISSSDNNHISLSEEDLKKYISTYDEEEKSQDYYYDEENNKLYIYNLEYIDNVIKEDNISLDDIKETIQNNKKIPGEYKDLLSEYSERVVSNYPDADLRVFYNNLQTMEIVECSKQAMFDETLNVNCSGYYDRKHNRIYVLEDNTYEKGSWNYQVIYHELSHTLTGSSFKLDNLNVQIQMENDSFNNEMTQEALNSLFAVSLFDYDEDHIAYQLQSNYYSVMTECMDYDFTDYVNKPLSDFPKQLDEYNNDDNAKEILELIQFQREDYIHDKIETEETEFYPIIDYLCDMYFRKYITEYTSYEDAIVIANNLENRILKNVPDDYKINTSRIYENLDNYYNSYDNTVGKTL